VKKAYRTYKIRLDEEMWLALQILKLEKGCRNIDEALKVLLDDTGYLKKARAALSGTVFV
jgi:hypothetical protein